MNQTLELKLAELSKTQKDYENFLNWQYLIIQNTKVADDMKEITLKVNKEKNELRKLRVKVMEQLKHFK